MSEDQPENRRPAGGPKPSRRKRSSRGPRKGDAARTTESVPVLGEDTESEDTAPENFESEASGEQAAAPAPEPARTEPLQPPRGMDRNQNRNRPQGPQGAAPPEGSEFSIQVMFDRQSRQYLATVLEFADIQVSGSNRDTVMRELELKIDDKLLELREDHQPIPEPLGTKRYPDSLSVRPSQALFRKLDVLSKQERQELSHLATELLTGAVERRYEQLTSGRQQQHGGHQQHQQHQGGGKHQDRHHHGGGGHNQKHHHGNRDRDREQGQGRGGRMSQRAYQNTMSSRENFMEYVRNLEKDGGAPPGGGGRGGWKKR